MSDETTQTVTIPLPIAKRIATMLDAWALDLSKVPAEAEACRVFFDAIKATGVECVMYDDDEEGTR